MMGRKASYSVHVEAKALLGRQHGGDDAVRVPQRRPSGAPELSLFVSDFDFGRQKGPKRTCTSRYEYKTATARLPTTKCIGAIRRPHTHPGHHSCGVPGVPRMLGEAAWPATSPSASAAAASACGEAKY